MNNTVKIALAQIDLTVGDIAGNTAKIIEYASRARDELLADFVVFPELSVAATRPKTCCFTPACAAEPNRPSPRFETPFAVSLY